MRTLYLCAAGNAEGIRLALSVNRAEGRWDTIVLLDDDTSKHGVEKLGVSIAGGFDLLRQADPARSHVVNLVTRTTARRARARERIGEHGLPFASLVHPGVDLFGTTTEAEVTIYPNAVIGAEAHVGEGSVVLVGAVVGHGAQVGRGCVIAPNAVINARVRLGDGVYVGSNASIVPDARIGDGATIAANSLVLGDVPARCTAFGAPATILAATVDDLDGVTAEHAPASPHPRSSMRAPRLSDAPSPREPRIASLLQEVLGSRDVSHDASFFQIGCDSLKALRLWERIKSELHVDFGLVEIYHHPTVHSLSCFLDGVCDGDAADEAQRRVDLRLSLRPRH